MESKKAKELVHCGDFLAEVDVDLLFDDGGWSPYLSLSDVKKIDGVRKALSRGDVSEASKYCKLYRLQPVAI